MTLPQRPTIVIAGATGFVGRAVAPALAPTARVVGLSRGARAPDDVFSAWRACDLFSLLDAERALEGADVAFYLVHSMMPSAHLTQGSFRDLDLVCADNFARAAKTQGVRQIVYLGGLAPDGGALSAHLESRLEVERALGAYGVPVTSLRAGLVIGAGGSSFAMLQRMVERLPAMICPSWTATRMQPIALSDVVSLLRFVVGRDDCLDQSFDVGSPDVLTYRELLALTAKRLGKSRPMISVPFLSVGLSRLWVSVVTGAPRDLVGPLVESLEHEMITTDRRLQRLAGVPGLSAEQALDDAFASETHTSTATSFPARVRDHRVRSVQRMALPDGRDAEWAADEYMRWLPRFFGGLIRVDVDEQRVCHFRVPTLGVELLTLSHSAARSTPDRQLFYVTGGSLARPNERGRFELRQVLGGRVLLAAIHDFAPRLPWPVYAGTQAPFHESVMLAFGRHLGEARRANRLLLQP